MAVLERLWAEGFCAYLVGGGVRDALLGRPIDDWDVATDARPEATLALFPGSTYENRFGTVLARGLEITTFRREHRYADHRRPDSVTFGDDVHEDLARRDLTINAIAWGRRGLDAPTRVVDPADGRGDLAAGLVRAVGDPGRRFDEDALRLLRAVRIAARLDFTIEPVTKEAMNAHAGDIAWVAQERIADEVRRMLGAAVPSRALQLLRETGLLRPTLPELADLAEDDASDAWSRTLGALDRAADLKVECLTLSALLCELAPEVARCVSDRLRVAGREREVVMATIAAASADLADASDGDVRRWLAGVPPARLDDVLALRRARSADPDLEASELELSARVQAQRDAGVALRLSELAVDGTDVREALGLPEGPLVGRILDDLLADVLEKPDLNSRHVLLARASARLEFLMDEGGTGA